MKSPQETPDVIKEAKRVSLNAAIGLTAYTLSIFPLMWISEQLPFNYSFLMWAAGGAVLAYFTDWAKLNSATTLL